MKHWHLALALVCFGSTATLAQSTPTADLFTWLKSQQANSGIGFDTTQSQSLQDRTKWVVTWWDAVSYGQKGLNVFAAGAKDYVDVGPGMSAANQKQTRYGLGLPVHVGNIWDVAAGSVPSGAASHFHFATLPDFSVSPMFLWPVKRPVNQWRWDRDFQIVVAYRYGGN